MQEEIPWAESRSRVTYRFEYAIVRFCREMTQKAAAELLKIPKSTISDLLHRIVGRAREHHRIRGLKVLGVDEISYSHGHKYATIVYDLQKSKVIWVGKGKGSDTFTKFIKTLSDYQRNQIRYACCDMAKAYISVIKIHLKKTTLIIDRFHIVKALNEAMDEVRKEEWRQLPKGDRLFLKGVRWILFKRSSSRDKDETQMITRLKKSNNRIYRAWLLKEEFEHFWDYIYTGSATKFLKSWTRRALLSRLEPIRDFVKTLRAHQEHIIPFIETGITNATAEGINRLLQMVKNRASGFLNLNAFTDLIFLVVGDVDVAAHIPAKFHTV